MKILIGVIGNDAARFHAFTASVFRMEVPDGSSKEMLIGGDWCGARNSLAEMCLDGGHSHLWFMDDDHEFPPNLLTLLARHDVPVVMPLCFTRVYPFAPVHYESKDETAEHKYNPIRLQDHPQHGLVEVVAGGCAGMLIRRDALEAVEPPWFEYTDRSEDIVFCEKVRSAGHRLYVDLEARLGHITTGTVVPAVSGGQWKTLVRLGKDVNVFFDLATETEQ